MIKNIRFYRVHSQWPEAESDLDAALDNAAFKPCGTFNERSMGFEMPVEGGGDLLCRRLAGADLIQLRIQSRILPAAAVKEALADRIVSFTQRTGRAPGRREKRELKEEVTGELLPKALLKSERISAFYIINEDILAVATPSATKAELLLDTLRAAFGSLQAVPLAYRQPAGGLMHQIFLGDAPDEFGLGRECRMKDPSEAKSTVNWMDMDLADKTVRTHVASGLVLDRLGFQFDGLLRCTLDQELVVRKLHLEGIEELDELDDEDPLARHDAEFTLLVGMVGRLLAALKKNLQGYAV